MSALASIAPRLGRLIRMLASDKDGEVLVAVRAIDHTLTSAGLDFHALAELVEHPPAVRQTRRATIGLNWSSLPPRTREDFLDWIVDAPWLSPWERDFTVSIREQFRLYGGDVLSSRQIALLNRLLRRTMEHRRGKS